jgi:putative DNA primase/helicase
MTTVTDLKSMPQWVGYDDRKIPKNPHTGSNAQTNNPATWSDAATAWKAKNRYRWQGIGFVFTLESGLVGIDLDDCFYRDDIGIRHIKPKAKDVCQSLDSYTEYSPSHNGLHIICRGKIQDSVKRDDIGFEMYNELRYFTMTGKQLGDIAEIKECSPVLQALYATFSPATIDNKPAPNELKNFTKISRNQIKEALTYIPIHQSYYDWLRVLMAVHDAFPGSTGVSLIESWSAGYKGEVERKFRSFERTAKDGVTIGTLFHIAKQNGFKPVNKKQYKNGAQYLSHKEIAKRLMAK